MNWLYKFIKNKKVPKIVDPLIGKTVIHFSTHGCMSHIHEFDYIGTIIDIRIDKENKKFYIVDILKGRRGEKRDGLRMETTVASWYLQDLGGDFFIAYD